MLLDGSPDVNAVKAKSALALFSINFECISTNDVNVMYASRRWIGFFPASNRLLAMLDYIFMDFNAYKVK
jgi:hypothetical protein